jgi:hypothetical protein
MSNRPVNRADRWWRILDRLLLGPPGSVPSRPVVSASVTDYPVARRSPLGRTPRTQRG